MGKYFIFKVNTSMNYRLQKPYFCKINDIKPGRHCYNVYCRVVKVNSSEITKFNGEVIRIADGVIGDDSGVANFRFVGENADRVKEGQTISIRNGRSEVVDEHIRLEVDKFGKIADEETKLKTANSIITYHPLL